MSGAPQPLTQQYPTSSSGYTAQLQREAIRCSVAVSIRQAQKVCCPQPVLKIQGTSQDRTRNILTSGCYNFVPRIPTTYGEGPCNGISTDPSGIQYPDITRIGYSAGGVSESARIRDLIDFTNQAANNPTIQDTRFLKYFPPAPVFPPCPPTPVPQTPVPEPASDACAFPGVAVSGPNPLSSQPTGVTMVQLDFNGNFRVTWVPGNDRSIVKYNVYVNGVLLQANVVATTTTIGPYSVNTNLTVTIEPVARNNWRGTRSVPAQSIVTFM
jgi:hypothetical protein